MPARVKGRILVVEDDRPLAELLEQELAAAGYDVTVAFDGTTALAASATAEFDLVVLDLNLPDMDGIVVAERLSPGGPSILMLTARADVESRVTGLYAGAGDYLTKPFNIEELLARVHARIRERIGPTETVRIGSVELEPASGTCRIGDVHVGLTTREFALLELLGRNRGRIYANADLEARLYGPDGPDSNTIQVFVSNVRRKLAAAGVDGLIETVRGSGYVIRRR